MDFRQTFDDYVDCYRKVFINYYPANGSTGFTERNQTCNLSKAIEKKFEESFTWFEAPFGAKNNNHFDAIIFIPEEKKILIVEAKRVKGLKKVNAIKVDRDRINECGKQAVNGEEFKEYTFYGVILCDIWVPNSNNSGIKKEYANNKDNFKYSNTIDFNIIHPGWSFKATYYLTLDFWEIT